ncbi:MAG TPA: hypothetical protein PLH22_01790 [Candidatus Colwellbacteria bacterium]|nr:hypothetical protein [Candidatus Colwellbacteria bacterium]
MKKTNFIIAAGLVSLIAFFPKPVLGAETKANAENLTTSVNQLIEVKDDKSMSDVERLAKELEARKQVVKDALSLSLKEISGLETSFKALKTKDERVSAFQKSSLEYLESAKAFYGEQAGIVDKLASMDEIKALAQKIKDYRDENYNKKIERITNFILLNQIDGLIATAETRWQKIDSDLKKLERGAFVSPGYFDANMQKAKKYINDAISLGADAKEHILKDFETEALTEESAPLTTTEITTAPSENTATAVNEEPTPKVVNPKELAEASLTNLKSSYDVFLQISQSVKKILQ